MSDIDVKTKRACVWTTLNPYLLHSTFVCFQEQVKSSKWQGHMTGSHVTWRTDKFLKWNTNLCFQNWIHQMSCEYWVKWNPFDRIFLLLPISSLPRQYNFPEFSFGTRMGDSDVGDIVMLMTLWWWRISDFGGNFFRYVCDFHNVFNQSPASWIGNQHLKLVTNTFCLRYPSPTP